MKTRISILAGCLMMILLNSAIRSQTSGNSGQSLNIFTITINGNGNSDEEIILQTNLAAAGYNEYDSKKMFIDNPDLPQIYTLAPTGQELVIQSVPPILVSQQFKLGTLIGKAGYYTFTTDLSSFSSLNNATLKDNDSNIVQDMRKNPVYKFYSNIKNDTNRFVINISMINSLNNEKPDTIIQPVPEPVHDTIPVKDTINQTVPVTSPDTIVVKDTISQPVPVTTPDTIVVKDTISQPLPVTTPDTIAIKDTISQPVPVTTPDTIVVKDTISQPVPVTTPDNIPINDIIRQTEPVTTPDNIPIKDTISQPVPVTMPDNIPIKDIIRQTEPVTTPDNIPIKDTISQPVPVIASDTIPIKDTFTPYTNISISDATVNNVSIYNTGYGICIDNCLVGADIMIFNISGKCYYQGIATEETEIIQSKFTTGCYIVRITETNNIITKKIFIQE